MSNFNMLNVLPHNVSIPEFVPERDSPIFPQITRKYPCQENIKGLINKWGTLTWKIQQPDPSMVFTSVKLVLPMKMQAMNNSGDKCNLILANKEPCCNIALQESPMNAFVSTSLTLNGKIFSQVNDYRRILDACYQGTGPSSYGDNHSLKPIVCRNLKSRNDIRIATSNGGYITTEYLELKTSSSAFSLLEHNGPFIERARAFQDQLNNNGDEWNGLITSYLELGPFQARARKGNTAVPYIRDMHLRLNFAENPSQWDVAHSVKADLLSPGQSLSSSRTVPCKLFEFGTPANMRHFNDSMQDVPGNWISSMNCEWTEKPYLEICYTKFLEPMKPSYNLRCYERQYQQSSRFQLKGHETNRNPQGVVARIRSRLLSMPTKIYLWAEPSDTFRGTWMLGGVRRSCKLSKLHCTLNNRPDIILNPSQEECFEIFQRHTNSSLEFAAWKKSPIYVFSCADLKQPDFFANDARICQMNWEANVALTPLQNQESVDSQRTNYQQACGYKGHFANSPTISHDGGYDWFAKWDVDGQRVLADTDTTAKICVFDEGDSDRVACRFDARGFMLPHKQLKFWPTDRRHWKKYGNMATAPIPSPEIMTITRQTTRHVRFEGFVWASVYVSGGQKGHIKGDIMYVPRSHEFMPGANRNFCNPFTRVVPNQAGNGYEITGDVATLNILDWKFVKTATSSKLHIDPGRSLAGVGATEGAQACPGPFGYIMHKTGLVTSGAVGGVLLEGAVGYLEVKNDISDSGLRWVCFSPSDAMISPGQDANEQWLVADTTAIVVGQAAATTAAKPNNATFPYQVPILAGENVSQYTGYGQCVVYTQCDITRENKPVADVQCAVPDKDGTQVTSRQGFGLYEQINDEYSTEQFDYNLKVLYEYGNAQYQFTENAMPTRILPNLVPVKANRDIPALQ